MIGYLRVPKTGSSALAVRLASLHTRLGVDVCSSGHFAAPWFLDHDHDHDWVTMIRDPFQTAISFYWMLQRVSVTPDWRKDPTPEMNPLAFQPQDPGNMALLGATVEEWLDACPANQFYGYYYPPLDPADFRFVGSVDHWDASIDLMAAVLGTVPLYGFSGNPNPDKEIGGLYDVDYAEADWRARNPLDYEMHERALERFSQLRRQHHV